MTEQADLENHTEVIPHTPELIKFPGERFGGPPKENNLLYKPTKILNMGNFEGRAEAADAVQKMEGYLKGLGALAGIAANQLGIDANVILCPQPPDETHPEVWLRPYVNTRIAKVTRETVFRREVCLSGETTDGKKMMYMVERPAGLEIEFENLEGKPEKQTLIGPLADIMWQEVDHIYRKTIDNTKGSVPNSGKPLSNASEFPPFSRAYKSTYPIPKNPSWIPYSEYAKPK